MMHYPWPISFDEFVFYKIPFSYIVAKVIMIQIFYKHACSTGINRFYF